MIYQFNVMGKQIDVFFNNKECSNKTGFNAQTIRNSINNHSLVYNYCYFSKTKSFKLPIQTNPIKDGITTHSEYLFLKE